MTCKVLSNVVTYSVLVAGSVALPPGLAPVKAVGACCPQPAAVLALHVAASMTETLRACAGLAPGPLLATNRVAVRSLMDIPSVPPSMARAGWDPEQPAV